MHLTKKCTGISEEFIVVISSILQNVLLIRKKLPRAKKKDKILDVIVNSRPDRNFRDLKQEFLEITGKAKLFGNQLKEI